MVSGGETVQGTSHSLVVMLMVVGAGLSVPRSLRDKIRSVGAAEDGERSMPIRYPVMLLHQARSWP